MKHVTIKNYEQAREYLGGKKSRPYAHNTRVVMDTLDMGHEVITVTYHDNPVVNFFPDGTNTYSSCGWKTITTKERINWFLPDGFRLYQEKSVWYLYSRWDGGLKHVFKDGISTKAGAVFNAGQDDGEVKKTIKAIKKFVDGYIKALLNGNVPAPSGGDCFHCVMVIAEGKDEGLNLGDAMGDTNHIFSHFEDSYYVPSLLVNAEKFSKRMSDLSKDGIARLWQGESLSDWQASIVARDVKSSLAAYLKHALGLAQ